MTDTTYYLRPDIVIEPLVARWHAAPHLIAPATAALNTLHRHLKIMDSYVAMPQMHAAALRDPALAGGPFIDLQGQRVDDIRALAAWTRQQQQNCLTLAADIAAAWKLLTEKAQGGSMAELYGLLPESLRGMVELVYTPNGAADLRLCEPLLYRSPGYDAALQGAMLRRISGDARPFAMATPRLDEADGLYLDAPFATSLYDDLARLRSEPRSRHDIASLLTPDLPESWLTTAAPQRRARQSGAGWRYFGHACVLLQTANRRTVLVDPLIAYESGSAPERFTFADLPDQLDYVVITHNHADHAVLETLLALRWKVKTVLVPAAGGSLADPSLKLALQQIGFHDVREFGSLDRLEDGDLAITAWPFLGEHADLDIRCKAAWLVETGNRRLLFAADSNNLDPQMYERLRAISGPVDTLFLGMECKGAPMSWLYGALLPMPIDRRKDQSRRLDGSDCSRAFSAIRALGASRVCIYALGLEPWLRYITSLLPDPNSAPMQESSRLIALCQDSGIAAERLYGWAEASL